jgi:hypothetical protein
MGYNPALDFTIKSLSLPGEWPSDHTRAKHKEAQASKKKEIGEGAHGYLFRWICLPRADFYRGCGNVCGLCMVFIWRAPRSSRVSRDLEKMLSRFSDFGWAVAVVSLWRNWWSVLGKTGVGGDSVTLVLDAFINLVFRE